MVNQYKKLIILLIILLAIPYPAWYGVNYYAAGTVDQTTLIKLGYEDDFLYCQEWRPELLGLNNIKFISYKKTVFKVRPKGIIQTNEYSPLHWVSKYGYVQILNILIKNHNIKIKEPKFNKTALQIAALNNQLDIIKILLDNGALINDKDSFLNFTALHNAVRKEHFDVSKYLLENGASINNLDKLNQTPFQYAVTSGNLRISKLLLEKGSNIHHKNLFGETSIFLAIVNGHLNIVVFLLKNGARINDRNIEGNTALQSIINIGEKSMIEFLIKNGIDINNINDYHKTALDISYYDQIENLLIKYGAKTGEQLKKTHNK